jgi:hypothetical protein
MKFFDYIYYCIYRYVLKTPDRKAADVWPHLFIAWTLWIHGLMAFWIFVLASEIQLPGVRNQRKLIGVGTFVILMLVFYWHYSWNDNGARVIHSFQKRGDPAKYAQMGAIMWWESLLLLFIVVGFLILSQKLTGWPPHP